MRAWKVQKFFGDVVYDLRNRGLLPVVGLLLVAMVAVPILLSRGGGSSSSSLQPTSAVSKPVPEAERAVVAYSPPGIRNYKQRLNDQTPKDPFRQQFAHSAATASKVTSTAAIPTSSGGSTGSSTAASTTSGTGTTGSAGSTGTGTKKSKSVKTTYKVNVLAGDVETTLTPFDDVTAMTPLPSQTTPVVLYYGLSSDHKQAQFLVSNRVGTVTGPGACVPSPDDCALLSLTPGQSEDLPYAQDGKTYRIVLAAIKTVKK